MIAFRGAMIVAITLKMFVPITLLKMKPMMATTRMQMATGNSTANDALTFGGTESGSLIVTLPELTSLTYSSVTRIPTSRPTNNAFASVKDCRTPEPAAIEISVSSAAPLASSSAPLLAVTTSEALAVAVMDVLIRVTREESARTGTVLSP